MLYRHRILIMQNNKKKRIIGIVIILMFLIITVLITGNTYCKYRTEVRRTGDFSVAKWSFLVNSNSGTLAPIELKNTYNTDTLVNGKIAPGTRGSFDILIDTTGSEVGIDYCIEFYNIAYQPENLVFSYEETEVKTLKELEVLLKGTIGVNDEEKQKTITINWEWKYQNGNTSDEMSVMDQIDTNDGINLNNFMFDIYVIGSQVLPN